MNDEIQLAAGTLIVGGGLSASTINSTGGILILNGGRLENTVLAANASVLGTSQLRDVTLSNATLKAEESGSGREAMIYGKGFLNGTGEIHLGRNSGISVGLSPSGSFVIGSEITVRVSTWAAYFDGGTTPNSRIVNQGTVVMGSWGNGAFRGHWENQGVVSAERSGSFSFSGTGTNSGMLMGDNRSTLRLHGTWTNTGVLSAMKNSLILLVEGNSIWSIERLTGVHRDTIMRLLVKVGNKCRDFLDAKMRGLKLKHLQLDENLDVRFGETGAHSPRGSGQRQYRGSIPVHRHRRRYEADSIIRHWEAQHAVNEPICP